MSLEIQKQEKTPYRVLSHEQAVRHKENLKIVFTDGTTSMEYSFEPKSIVTSGSHAEGKYQKQYDANNNGKKANILKLSKKDFSTFSWFLKILDRNGDHLVTQNEYDYYVKNKKQFIDEDEGDISVPIGNSNERSSFDITM